VEYLVTMTTHLPEGTPGIADPAIRPVPAPLGKHSRSGPYHDGRGGWAATIFGPDRGGRTEHVSGYFPLAMATSIISTRTFLLGLSWLSRVLLAIASAGLAVLIVALAIQLVFFRPSLAAGFHDPGRVFSFFAIAAGMDVLGIRLAAAGPPLATGILAGVAAAAFVARILRERVSWW
jgi:hypothetical protein